MTPRSYRITTDERFERLRRRLSEASDAGEWVSFDLETRSPAGHKYEDHHEDSRIVSAAFSFGEGKQAFAVPLSHHAGPWYRQWEVVADELFALLKGARLVGANGKYDMRWILTHCDIDLSPWYEWDTQAAAFALDENQAHGLKPRAIHDLGVDAWDGLNLDDAERAPLDKLLQYNGLDAAYTLQLMHWQTQRLREDPKLAKSFWHILMPTLRAIVRVEYNGIPLDLDEVERRAGESASERDRLYFEFESQVDLDFAARFHHRFALQQPEGLFPELGIPESERLSLSPTSKFFKAYAEKHWPVIETTNKGAPSWGAAVMKRLAHKGHTDAEILSAYRKVDKQLSSFLRRWPTDVHSDGRLRPTYKAMRSDDGSGDEGGSRTGRASCERPNLHQVDRTLKTCFAASPRDFFVSIDYSQVELRFAAMLSGDESLREAYRQRVDVHSLTAAAVTGQDVSAVTPDQRQHAKPVNFGFLFGQLPPGFVRYAYSVYGIEFSLAEAEEVREKYFQAYPGLLDYHERIRRELRRHKQVRNPFGGLRRLPEVHSQDQRQRWSAERKAINYPIQSGAAGLMFLALSALVDFERESGAFQTVGSVHDSALFLVPEGDVDEVVPELARLMLRPPGLAHFDVDAWGFHDVPLAVDCEIGERWGAPDETRQFSSSDQEQT